MQLLIFFISLKQAVGKALCRQEDRSLSKVQRWNRGKLRVKAVAVWYWLSYHHALRLWVMIVQDISALLGSLCNYVAQWACLLLCGFHQSVLQKHTHTHSLIPPCHDRSSPQSLVATSSASHMSTWICLLAYPFHCTAKKLAQFNWYRDYHKHFSKSLSLANPHGCAMKGKAEYSSREIV